MVGRELITVRQKTRNHGYDVIVGGELFTDWPRSPSQTCHAKPKTQSTGAGRYQLFSCWWDSLPQAAWPERLLLRKVNAVALQQIKERGALPMIDQVISVRQSTVAVRSGLHCRALVMVSLEARRQPDCKIQRSGRNGQRD